MPSSGRRQRIEDSPITELICSNSVPMARGPRVTTLSVAGLLGEAIRRIHQGESVSSLFQTQADVLGP